MPVTVQLATGDYRGAERNLLEALGLARQMGIPLDVSAELDALRSAPIRSRRPVDKGRSGESPRSGDVRSPSGR